MKVAFFNYLPMSFGGGLARFYTQITAGLRKRYPSVKPHIVSFDEKTAQLIQGMYSTYFLRNETLAINKKATHPTAHTIYQMGKLLSTFDLIYSKNDILDLTLLSLARLSNRLPPVIVGFHTPVHYARTPTAQSKMHNMFYSSLYYRSLLKQASAFHVLNAFHEQTLTSWFPHKPVAKIFNPIDTELFKVSSRKSRGPLRLLWVGRLTPDKGCSDLIRLIKETPRRVNWTIIGGGAMRKSMSTIIKNDDNVTWHLHLTLPELAKEYRRNDVLVSTSNWECLPYTVLEAQYSGLPVVAYDIPGNLDIIVDRKTGILAKSYEKLESGIVHFKSNRFDKKQIRHLTEKRFDTNNSYRLFYTFLKRIHEQSLR